jgi:hypothetical protein
VSCSSFSPYGHFISLEIIEINPGNSFGRLGQPPTRVPDGHLLAEKLRGGEQQYGVEVFEGDPWLFSQHPGLQSA